MKQFLSIQSASCVILCALCCPRARAQEAASGVDLRATLTGQAVASKELTDDPRSGSPIVAGFHGVLYPTIKFNDQWFVSGALQLTTRPYFFDDLSDEGYGANGNLLHATLGYSRVSAKGSVLVRAGEMLTAFGAFPLHYDDADNALLDYPSGYGYYYAPIGLVGLTAAQVDGTRGKWDARAQFANSSPSNPRSIFARDQYGNWAGGAGFTIRQGFRAGFSALHGPYLDRKSPLFFPGEANPSKLPEQAFGIDVNWAYRHTSAQGEVQHFVFPYKAVPTFRESAGYGEVKQVLGARWIAAGRYGFITSKFGTTTKIEAAAGYRPDRFQLIKAGFEVRHYSNSSESDDHIFAVQFITTFHKSAGVNLLKLY